MGRIGVPELIFIGLVIILLFGAKKLPDVSALISTKEASGDYVQWIAPTLENCFGPIDAGTAVRLADRCDKGASTEFVKDALKHANIKTTEICIAGLPVETKRKWMKSIVEL